MGQDKFPKATKPGLFTLFDPHEVTPPFDRVTSVAVVPFLEDGRMVATVLERGLDIPGGHVQQGETSYEQVVQREAMEEACIEVGDLRVVKILQSDYYGSQPHELTYLIVMAGKVTALHDFSPQHEALDRRIVTTEEFLSCYTAGDKAIMRVIVEAALK